MHSLSLYINRRVILPFSLVLFGGLASMAKTFNVHGQSVRELEVMLGGDAVLHAIVAILLGLSACWATPKYFYRHRWFRLPPLLIIMVFLVCSDELLQAVMPRREFSWLDLAINLSGLLVGAVCYRIAIKREGF